MKKSELQKIVQEEIQKVLNETYYNPEWTLQKIQDWIETYAMNNKLNFKLVKKLDKSSAYGSKTTFYVYDIGNNYGIVIKDDKVAGAPRLSDIEVIIGTKGSGVGNLTNATRMNSSDGNEQYLYKTLTNIVK